MPPRKYATEEERKRARYRQHCAWRERNKEHVQQYGRKYGKTWRAANRQQRALKNRWYWLLKKYGITKEQYEQMLADQGSRCAICSSLPPEDGVLVVDHDHATGKVRGLLCDNCNVGLGRFRDCADTVLKAHAYLTKGK